MNEAHSVVDTNDTLAQIGDKGLLFEELVSRPEMSAAIYQLPAGAEDPQTPHGEEEIYLVIAGVGQVSINGADHAIDVGDLIDVPAGAEHRFHSITQTLRLLAVFAPAFGTADQ